MASRTTIKKDLGEGQIGDMKTSESKMVSNTMQGSANELIGNQSRLDMNKDGRLSEIDFAMLRRR
jgi:hypothetical protein|tara:strand:- start:1576 stop:1770 length:195 start_codon:yes stop_codon:yes gene_type:complete